MPVAEAKTSVPSKTSFRAQMHLAREEAIVSAVHRLLADKGFDAMTVDEVAAEAGMAKPSLYRHFSSKEELAGAAMVRVMERAWAFLNAIECQLTPLQRLHRVVRWMLEMQWAGEMPSLPSENSSLRAALMVNPRYMTLMMDISELLGSWIEEAQSMRQVNPALPTIAVLYTLYARACDPVVGFLRGTGQFSQEQIVDWVTSTCFDGLAAR